MKLVNAAWFSFSLSLVLLVLAIVGATMDKSASTMVLGFSSGITFQNGVWILRAKAWIAEIMEDFDEKEGSE